MANSPHVSVIVPVHNTEKWLPRCLNSLTYQTLQGLEIICIDDASTDDSWNILQSYAQRDPRIRLLRNLVNEGAGASRNRGLDVSRGEYVGFVDSDDFVFLSFYKLLYEAARGADIVKGDIWGFDNEEEEVRPRPHYGLNALILENKNWFCSGFTSAIFRRELIYNHDIRFPELIRTMEDPCFTIGCVLRADTVTVVEDAVYIYAENPRSVTCTMGGAPVVSATERACALIGEMVREAGTSPAEMPIIAFLAQMLHGIALVPDAADEDIRALADSIMKLYASSQVKQEFLYYCMQCLRKRIFAINDKNEFFLGHAEELTHCVRDEMENVQRRNARRQQMLKVFDRKKR